MTEYINYFRNLAVKHKSILHNPQNEGTAAAPNSCKFATFTTGDIVASAKTTLSTGVAVLLHEYDFGFTDNGAGDFRMEYTGAILITKQARADNIVEQMAVKQECEAIMRDFIAQMKADSEKTPSFQNILGIIDWNKASMTPVDKLWNSRYGWWLDFTFQKKDKTIHLAETLANAFNP